MQYNQRASSTMHYAGSPGMYKTGVGYRRRFTPAMPNLAGKGRFAGQAKASTRKSAPTALSPLDEYKQAYNAARQREERRFKNIEGGYKSRYRRGMQMLEGMGSAARDELNRGFDRSAQSVDANMTGLGLQNTTVGSSLQQGVDRERAAAQRLQEEGLRRERLSADAGLSGDLLAFQERPTTKYPDLNLMASLAAQGASAGRSVGGPVGGGPVGAAPVFAGAGGMGYGQRGFTGGNNSAGARQQAASAGARQQAASAGARQQAAAEWAEWSGASGGDRLVNTINGQQIFQSSNGRFYTVVNGRKYPVDSPNTLSRTIR